ncbi:MAG: BTAD domain-containing putative transcriptional regulator [Gammaproteobacteria bacterium]
MAWFELRLLGRFEARLKSGAVVDLKTRKGELLLTYLALSPGKSFPRDKLAALLWSDRSEEQARHSLRQTLTVVRNELNGGGPPPLVTEGDRIGLSSGAMDTDVTAFERLVASGDAEELAQACALYRGDLLEDVNVRDEGYEEWLLVERQRLHGLALRALDRLLVHQEQSNATDQIVDTAQRLLKLEPAHETAHRALMRLYAEQGHRDVALRQYQECRAALKRELNAEPGPETEQLYRALLEGPVVSPTQVGSATVGPRVQPVSPTQMPSVDIPSVPAMSRPARRGRTAIVAGVLTLAAAALLIITARFWEMKDRSAGPPLPEKPSIAVLPFDNIGDSPQWVRFADGITEDIITDLSHSKDIIVIARNSTEVYKGRPVDIRQIGRELAVKYVLEGTIQSMGERIRVTAQLVETASGSHVWSERYDRPVDDLFAVQNDVTQRIAAKLIGYEGAVAEAERGLLRRKPPANLTAYDTYLLAMEAKHKVTKESLTEAEGLFRKALELDPQLARAYVGLADVYFYLIDLGLAPSVEEALSKMMEAAKKAVQLDPDDGKTHYALGVAYAYHGKPEQALAEFDRAEALAPSDADVLIIIAWTIPALGESARAVSLAERSLTLNPHYPDWYNQGLGLVFFFGEQYEKSVKYRLLVKDPFALDYAFLAMAYAYLGRTGEAETAAANVVKLDPGWIAERYLSEAGGYADKEAELFVNGARKAGLPDCVPGDKLKDVPNLVHVKSCDQQRASVSW